MISAFPEQFVLIMIEDDEGHARLIERNLKRSGFGNEIIHLKNGEEAIEYFFGNVKTTLPSCKMLVLLDLNLPGIDGFEILARLKQSESTHDIPVIVLTTTDYPKEIERCYELGCNAYIAKPVQYDSFTNAIQKLGLMLNVVQLPHTKIAANG